MTVTIFMYIEVKEKTSNNQTNVLLNNIQFSCGAKIFHELHYNHLKKNEMTLKR